MLLDVITCLNMFDGLDPSILTYVGGCPHVLLLHDNEAGGQVPDHSANEEDPVES